MQKDLINEIKRLKAVHPSQEWLDSTRYQLMSQATFDERNGNSFCSWLIEPQISALIACFLLIVVGGPWLAVKASEASLPGELLYSVKQASEGIQSTITSENAQSGLQMEFAKRRIKELEEIDEGETEKMKQVVESFKNNLADASAYVGKASKDQAVVIAKKTQKIRDELSKTKEEITIEEIQTELAEAEKQIEEINHQILAVLIREKEEGLIEPTGTTTDEEILIFLENVGLEVTTTSTGEIIDVKEIEEAPENETKE